MVSDIIKIVHITDLHLGHRRVPPKMAYSNIDEYIFPSLTDDVDLLTSGGDIFDSMLTLGSEAAQVAWHLNRDIQHISATRNIIVRGVRGTIYHDRTQNDIFHVNSTQNQVLVNGDELIRIYDTITIEYIKSLGIYILYLPDGMIHDNILETAREMMDELHIDKVDICIHHGYVSHLMPPVEVHDTRNVFPVEEYAKLVKGPILNGHIHTSSVKGKFINGGSFERSKHDEEEPKGYFIVEYNKKTTDVWVTFIENRGAIEFITKDISTIPAEDVVGYLQEYLSYTSIPKDYPFYLRLINTDTVIRPAIISMIKRINPRIVVSWTKSKEDKTSAEEVILERVDLPKLDPEDLPAAIVEHLSASDVHYTIDEVSDIL